MLARVNLIEDAVDIAFRHREPGAKSSPQKGEIDLRPSAAPNGRVELALRAIDAGFAAFPHGEGPIERIIVQADPTLDDMLAAAIIEQLILKKPLPRQLRLFAAYAANVRDGYKPTDLPLKDSLEGAYLGIRCAERARLTEPAEAERFLRRWRPMAERIWSAAEQGVNPVSTPLFSDDADFAWIRAQLAHDREIYVQQDLPQADRWQMRIPAGPPHRLPGLLLRQPRSALWKYWAREDPGAPGGNGYVFLAAFEDERHWRFSTPPGQKISLAGLAERLQQAEAARDPASAARDPWYDGRSDHSIVAAPHAGTKLSDREVLRVVKSWGKVEPIGGRAKWPIPLAATAAIALAIVVLIFPRPAPAANHSLFQVSAQFNGAPLGRLERDNPEHTRNRSFFAGYRVKLAGGVNRWALNIASDRINHPCKFSVTMEAVDASPLPPCRMKLIVDGQQTQLTRRDDLSTDRTWQSADVPALLSFGEHVVDLELTADAPASVRLQLNWAVDFDFHRDLYLLTVGVSKYEASRLELDYADRDAEDLSTFFEAQTGPGKLFAAVKRKKVLLNEAAKQENIIEELNNLRDRVNRAQRPSLVVVAFSGHGGIDETGRFFLLPYNYDPDAKDLDAGRSVSWEAVEARLRGMHWPVVVILDACHSGAAQNDSRLRKTPDALAPLRQTISALDTVDSSGVLTLAACGSGERTWESPGSDHGTLTLAVLEALGGQRLVRERARTPLPQELSDGGPITVEDLCKYADTRVRELAGAQTDVIAQPTERMVSSLVPITPNRGIRQ